MANTSKSFKISQLPEMLSSNISDDDLLMVSDYNDGECKSKKLTFNQLNASIAQSDQIKNAVSSNVQEAVSDKGGIIQPMIENSVSSAISAALLVLDGGNSNDF